MVLTYSNNYGGNRDSVCVLDGDSAPCWGRNDNGATGGSNGVNPVPAPTLVVTNAMATLRGLTDIEEGQTGYGALRNDQTMWLWGQPDGNTASAKSYGVPNVQQVGWAGGDSKGVRYLTTDGVYHSGMNGVTVTCGAFQ